MYTDDEPMQYIFISPELVARAKEPFITGEMEEYEAYGRSWTVMEEIDIWRSATQQIRMHGEDAAIRSAMRADELLAAGDTEGFRVWQRIVTAINELQRQSPHSGEAKQ